MKLATVLSLFITPAAGEPMQEIKEVTALAGLGLEGDRYALGKGAFSHSKRITIRQVSIITQEGIYEANALLKIPFTPAETRRNILIKGMSAQDLNEFVGKEFSVGEAVFRGIELCTPCSRPAVLTNKPEFKEAFHDRGGLRAEVLKTGTIKVGDEFTGNV